MRQKLLLLILLLLLFLNHYYYQIIIIITIFASIRYNKCREFNCKLLARNAITNVAKPANLRITPIIYAVNLNT